MKINYLIKLSSDQPYEIITILKDGHTYCSQSLNVKNLFEYAKISNSDTIINDATYINSCLRMDVESPSEYEHFTGLWSTKLNEIYIYYDGKFYFKYLIDDISFQKEGKSKIIDETTIVLNTKSIKNNFTGTHFNHNEEIILVRKKGMLISEDLDIKLRKQ